ncbi:MAG: 3-phosphoshikimate 1-carboxyvinyltransferase [Pseudomonadota bacterium]
MPIIHKKNTDIKEDHNIKSLLARMPNDEIKDSFSNEQLESLKIAMGARDWKTHTIDIRFTLPIFGKRYYFVLIAGKSIRSSRLQRAILRKTEILFIALIFSVIFMFALLIIYLVKSALGINLFSDFSLGIWDWLKQTML